MNSIRVLITIHHRIIRDGIHKILSDKSGIEVLGSTGSLEELFSSLEEQLPDILILDLDMPDMDGVLTIRELRSAYPDLRMLAISDIENRETIREILQEEVDGYLLKKSGIEELQEAIKSISEGHQYVCDNFIKSLTEKEKEENKSEGEGGAGLLTTRELEVLKHICLEMTNKEIAEMLGISVRTVDAHRRNILQKTGARNTAGLVKYAIKLRLLKP